MKNIYDLIIIGGGAAGMMAAISAKRHHPELSVAIIDRTFALGRKILVCGAGRCNITNKNLDASIDDHFYGSTSEFLHSIFDQFNYKDIVNFFNELGIELYVERKTDIGKLFPITDQAKTVTELMLDEIERAGIEIFLNTHVSEIRNSKSETLNPDKSGQIANAQVQNKIQISNSEAQSSQPIAHGFSLQTHQVAQDGTLSTDATSFYAQKLIVSAGGRSYPALGSNGSGYDLMKELGHKIVEPVPSALPIEANHQLHLLMQGMKQEVEVTSIIDDQEIKTRTDDVMFTKYGLSGPAILNISREISIHFNRENKNNCQVKLNFFPGKSRESIKQILEERWSRRQDQSLEKSLYGLFPNKFANAILKVAHLDTNMPVSEVSKPRLQNLLDHLTNLRIKITGTRSWNEAEFTAGGVDTVQIKPGTLESSIIPNLYLCGEILNVDGDVGGFNLSWSWSSGWVAGQLK